MGFELVGNLGPVWVVGLVTNGLMLLGSFWIARHGFGQGAALLVFLGPRSSTGRAARWVWKC